MQRREQAQRAQHEAEMASYRRKVEQQLSNCQQLRAQWNANPQIRTSRNANVLNSVCQSAEADRQAFNADTLANANAEIRSELLASHPVDQSRIAAIVASTDVLAGRRSLDDLAAHGQAHKVYLAMRLNAMEAAAGRREVQSQPQPSMQPPSQSISGGFAAQSRQLGESCNSNSDCVGSMRCDRAVCIQDPNFGVTSATGGVFRPESRQKGESCNSNSDCVGSLRCEGQFCRAD